MPKDNKEEKVDGTPKDNKEVKEEKGSKDSKSTKKSGNKIRLKDGSLRGKTIHTEFGNFDVDKEGYTTGSEEQLNRLKQVFPAV